MTGGRWSTTVVGRQGASRDMTLDVIVVDVVGVGGAQIEANTEKIGCRQWTIVKVIGRIHGVADEEEEGGRRINYYQLGTKASASRKKADGGEDGSEGGDEEDAKAVVAMCKLEALMVPLTPPTTLCT